jgi:hypothetical protein
MHTLESGINFQVIDKLPLTGRESHLGGNFQRGHGVAIGTIAATFKRGHGVAIGTIAATFSSYR